jgi:hypothetical protein
MKEVKGNIWDFYGRGNWVVITTNGTVKRNGACVVGRGITLEAKNRIENLDKILGKAIQAFGNQVFVLQSLCGAKIISFPVKHNWYEKADLDLIERSCKQLSFINENRNLTIYMPRPGCGNGRLDWNEVRPILEKYLDDRFVVVNNE